MSRHGSGMDLRQFLREIGASLQTIDAAGPVASILSLPWRTGPYLPLLPCTSPFPCRAFTVLTIKQVF
jgi:hypothetical protein